jgi:hypothetical protein
MPLVGFEPTIPVFERAKTVHVLDHAITGIGGRCLHVNKIVDIYSPALRTYCLYASRCRAQWPRGRRHELSSLTRTLGSWVRVPFKAWMSVLFAFILRVGRDLATGSFPVQGGLPTVYRVMKLKKCPKAHQRAIQPL